MPIKPIENPSKARATWLHTAFVVVMVVLLLSPIAYREYYDYFFPQEIDPVSHWLFVENRIWSLISCCFLAVLALVLEWRRYRQNGKSSLFASFPGIALLATVATFFIYIAFGK